MKELKKLEAFRVQVRQKHKQNKFQKIRLQHELNTMNFYHQPLIVQLDLTIGKLYLSTFQEEREALADKLLSLIQREDKQDIERLWVYRWANDVDLFGELSRRRVSEEKMVQIFGALRHQNRKNEDLRNESIIADLLQFSYESLISSVTAQLIESIFRDTCSLIKVFLNSSFEDTNVEQSELNKIMNRTQMLNTIFSQRYPGKQIEQRIVKAIREDDFVCNLGQLVSNNDACLQKIETWLEFIGHTLYIFNRGYKQIKKKRQQNEEQESELLICQITSPIIKMFNHINFQLLLSHLLETNQEKIMAKILSSIKLYKMLSSVQDKALQNIYYFYEILLNVPSQSNSFQTFQLIFLVLNEQVYNCDQMCYLGFRKYLQHFYHYLKMQLQHKYLVSKQLHRKQNILKSLPKLLVNFLINQLAHDCESDFLFILESIMEDIPTDLLDLLFTQKAYLESGQYLLTLLLNTKNKKIKRELCQKSYYQWRILEHDNIETSLKQKVSMLCFQYEIGQDDYLEYWLQNYSELKYTDETSDKEQHFSNLH